MTNTGGLTFKVRFRGATRAQRTPNTATVVEPPTPPESTPKPAGTATEAGTEPRARTVEDGNDAASVGEPAAHRATRATPRRQARSASTAPRLARMLALAYVVEREIEAGRCRDYVAAAERLGITRARMTQIMNLATLSPRIQNAILNGLVEHSERTIRTLSTLLAWRAQEDTLSTETTIDPSGSEFADAVLVSHL